MKYWFIKYAGLLFCVFIIIVNIFIRDYDVTADGTKIFLLFIYFLLSSIFIFAMFKAPSEKTNIVAALMIPLIILGVIDQPILLITVIGILIFYAKSSSWKRTQRIALCLYAIIYCVGGILWVFLSCFNGMSQITLLQEIPSPDREYRLILKESDQGALGGAVIVFVEQNITKVEFMGIVKKISSKERKIVYRGRWGERPKILWIDNETISINDKIISIHKVGELIR